MKNTLHKNRDRNVPRAVKDSHASTMRKARHGSKPDALPAEKRTKASERQERLDAGLLKVVETGSMESVEELLRAGASVNAMDKDGSTALMRASFLGHRAIARFLVANGADVNARDSRDWTAVGFAGFSGHFAIRNMLRQHGGQK